METPRLRHDTSESSETTDNSTDKHTSLYSLKLREYSPLKHILDLIPLKAQRLLNTFDVNFLSLDVTTEFVAVGSSIGTLYLYERQTGNLQRYRYEDYVGNITTVRLYEGLHSLVSFGTENGRVIVFTIPTGGSLTKAHRYDIVNVHTHPITALEWNDNGYHLYSGDKSGLVVETEFDLIRKLCKSREMLKEPWSVVELKIGGTTLAISTLQRALLYDLTEGGVAMLQIGKRERKSYGKYGIIFNSSNTVITSRPGLRLWKADLNGTVLETMLIKKSLEILDHHSIILLKNDCPKLDEKIPREIEKSPQFEKLLIFQDIFILTWNNDAIFIIDPETAKVVGSSRGFEGKLLDVATHRNEIFILEEPRKIRRLGIEPEEIMYPQINIPRSGKDEFSFLSAMNLPFHRLVKKSSESNEENTSEKSSKVLSWIKKLTAPDKVETPDEARLFDNTPMNEIKQAATLTDTENTNLVVYQQAMKRNSKKKHKDYVDGSKLEKSSEDFQWDNYQSRSPKSAHYFPLDESLEDDKKELFDNQESPALRFNNIENESSIKLPPNELELIIINN